MILTIPQVSYATVEIDEDTKGTFLATTPLVNSEKVF